MKRVLFYKLSLCFLLMCLISVKESLSQITNRTDQILANYTMTLEEVINTALDQSPNSLIAKYNFLASYWSFRSYKAEMLPSLYLSAGLGQYNRSLVALRDAVTGETNYVQNNNLMNSLTLSLTQNIALTGGRISVSSSLDRLDQFSPIDKITYNSQPINVQYSQPIFGFNSYKWDKNIEPKKFEYAKRVYLEAMEGIAVNAASRFFSVLLAQERYRMAEKNYENTKILYGIAQERFRIGAIAQDDLLQLELSMLNDQMSINEYRLDAEIASLSLSAFLGFNEFVKIELSVPEVIPALEVDFSDVLEKSLTNTSFAMDNELNILEAQRSVASAKGTGGLQVLLNARFGLNQSGENFSNVYAALQDQEILGLTLSIPIFDWGMKKGKIKMANSREEIVRTQVDQMLIQHQQDVLIRVVQFNNQKQQCEISAKADGIAVSRYNIAMERFRTGLISVLDVNTAQREKDQAMVRYITELNNYWSYYLGIRRTSLYDYQKGEAISANFDLLVE